LAVILDGDSILDMGLREMEQKESHQIEAIAKVLGVYPMKIPLV